MAKLTDTDWDQDYSVNRPVNQLYSNQYLTQREAWLQDLKRRQGIAKHNPNHDEKGRFASGPSDGGIKDYLKVVDKAQGGRPSVDKFILDHGRAFRTDDKTFQGGEVHQCYKNACLASLNDPSLTYAEGYVSVHGVPVHHAWTVDKDGVVRDPTIEDGKGIKGYYGVPMKDDFVMQTTLKRGKYGVLVHENHRLITTTNPDKIVKK